MPLVGFLTALILRQIHFSQTDPTEDKNILNQDSNQLAASPLLHQHLQLLWILRWRYQCVLHLFWWLSLPTWVVVKYFLPVCTTCGCVFVHVKCGLQILSFCVSGATVYSTPTHSANSSWIPPPPSISLHPWTPDLLLHLSFARCSLLSNHSHLYYCIYLNHTPPRTLFLSHSMNDIKQHDWRGKYCGLEPLATDSTTHTHRHTHTYTHSQPHTKFLLAQQNTHTKSLKD